MSRSVAVTFLSVLCLSAIAATPGVAQSQPIYPHYEGWTANPDGTFTLVFGYHNANSVAVEIAPGPDNGFVAEVGGGQVEDRGQPVRFLPGRQRSVCRMVVPSGFQGNLAWRLSLAGTITDTTERGGLDPLYLLEEIGPAYRATRDIDTAQVVKGRCINRAPSVSAGREGSTVVGAALELGGFASDDGLPRGSTVTSAWSKVGGPGGVTFSEPGSARTSVSFDAAGDYQLELVATDTELESSAQVTVHVSVEPETKQRN